MEQLPVTVRLTTAIEGEDTVAASYDGLLRTRGNALLLSYTEENEGVSTATLLVIDEERMSLTRRGGVTFFTVYEPGRSFRSHYSLGGLTFDALTETESLTVLRGATLPAVDCTYQLTLGGEKRRFSLSLRVLPKEAMA